MESIEQINYIKAPIKTVYKALTSEDGLGQVWTKKLKVKPEIGFINEFDFDEGYITKMKSIELQENKKIVWDLKRESNRSSQNRALSHCPSPLFRLPYSLAPR